MKRLYFIPILILTLQGFGQSKKFTFKLGSEYELPRKTTDLAFFGNQHDGIVNMALKNEELFIMRFDSKTLQQNGEKVIELPEATKNFNSEIVSDLGDNYYWIHSDWDKKEEKELLYYDKVDVIAGKRTETDHKMIEASRMTGTMVATGFYQAKTTNKYQFNYDVEHKKLLVSYRLYPEEKNDKKNYDKIGLCVFDEKMNKLWSNEFTMPYTEAIMDNSDFSVDSKGNAYLLAKVYDSDSRKEKDKSTGLPAYHYEVLKFTKESKQIVHTPITIGDDYIKEATLIENSLHDMIIACTYSKKSKGNSVDGIFLAAVDQEGKVIKYKNGYYEFPLAELEKYESARKKRKMEKKDDYEASNLKVREVVVENDGSVLISCEEYHVEEKTTYSSPSTMGGSTRSSTTITYYYEDIIATKVNVKGDIDWVRKIPKRQLSYSKGTETLGYKLVSDSTGYYFLYLDNLKNMDLAEGETPATHIGGAGGQLVVNKIDNKGTVTKELVFDTREEKFMISPRDFYRINGNQFIGRATLKKNNNFQPVLVTVNK